MRRKLDLSPQTQLLAALLGSSLALAIQQVTATSDFDTARAVLALAIMASAANFFHGKSQVLIDPFTSTRLAARTGAQILMNTSNLAIFVCFSLMAARLGSPKWVLVMMLILRVVGIVVVAVDLRLMDGSIGRRDSNEANPFLRQRFLWLTMDVIFVLACAALLKASTSEGMWRWRIDENSVLLVWTTAVLGGLILVELFFEYAVFGSLYFSEKSNWDELAERWDRIQGRYGDWQRTRLINPLVSREINEVRPRMLVDLGCGNGCVARYVSDTHGLPVMAIDSSPYLIELARLYERRNAEGRTARNEVSYFASHMESMSRSNQFMETLADARTSGGRVLFLAIQSFPGVDRPVEALSELSGIARDGDRLMIVTEKFPEADLEESDSVTMHHWKYSFFRQSNKQLVYWLPVSATSATSLFHGTEDGPGLIAVEATHRPLEDLLTIIRSIGNWRMIATGPIALGSEPMDVRELRYAKTPKLEFAILERSS